MLTEYVEHSRSTILLGSRFGTLVSETVTELVERLSVSLASMRFTKSMVVRGAQAAQFISH
jgi:hypothetical protein